MSLILRFKFARKSCALLLAVFLLATISPAHADADENLLGWTIGAGGGRASVDVRGYAGSSVSTLDVERELTRELGLFLGSRHFGEFSTHGLSSSADLNLEGYEAGIVARKRLDEDFTVRVMAGYMNYDLVAHALGRKIGSESDGTPTLGFGLQYSLSRSLGLQADAKRAFTVSDATVDWISLSLFARFGRHTGG